MIHFLLKLILRGVLFCLEIAFFFLRKKTSVPYPYDKQTRQIHLPPEVEKELRKLVASDQKIEAVKRITQLTGAGLRRSKDYVDRLA